jgi:hypothetical protein
MAVAGGTSQTEGRLTVGERLQVTVESNRLVVSETDSRMIA